MLRGLLRVAAPFFPARFREVARNIERRTPEVVAATRSSLVDLGWFGCHSLEHHVVVCGFPRSGSTLLALMLRCCVDDALTFDTEVRALEVARLAKRNHRFMATKCPDDVFDIDALRDFYAGKRGKPLFVLTLRDPRAVLTSHHVRQEGYYVNVARWRQTWQAVQEQLGREDVLCVRYEDLVRNCRQVQDDLASFTGWNCRYDFENYLSHIPPSFNTRALNGVRPLDPSTIDRWRSDEHRDRVRELLTNEFPELCERLIQMGYETDDSWTHEYGHFSRQGTSSVGSEHPL